MHLQYVNVTMYKLFVMRSYLATFSFTENSDTRRREGFLTTTEAADNKDGSRGKRYDVQQGAVGVHMRFRVPTW